MRYPSMTALSIAAAVLWLAPSVPASAGQRGHGGPPPSVHANHPTPPTSHGGGSDHGAKGPHAGAPKASSSFVARIQGNPQLSSRLTALLPANTTLAQAASGFKNQGQFIAALHVSHNLGIPFDKLKTEITGPNHSSLGKAIETLKPTADAGKEVKTAENEAKDDVKTSTPPKTASTKTD